MNYGWLIVLVVVIGISLWYLGIFDVGSSVASYDGFTRIQPLVESVIFTTDGDFAARFVNGAGSMITVNNITVVNHDGTECHCTINGSSIIRAGKAFNMGGTACSNTNHSEGRPFLIQLTINYTMNIAAMDVGKVENGTIRGVYGGAIGDVVAADSDIQGCLGVGGYWLGNDYCRGGDGCAEKPKCCGDDPSEYYKSSWSTVCCRLDSSCGSFSPSHYCWIEGTTGTTAGQSNEYICNDGAWLQCSLGNECTAKSGYTCTWNSGAWLWRDTGVIEESTAEGNCADSRDNDCDGNMDGADPDC